MIASLLSLVAQLSGKEQLSTHVQTVIDNSESLIFVFVILLVNLGSLVFDIDICISLSRF